MKKDKCRVIVLGANRNRLQKVFEQLLLLSEEDELDTPRRIDDAFNGDGGSGADDRGKQEGAPISVDIEFLPCVPAFESYREEETGRTVRYLARLDYLGPDARHSPPGTILPFLESGGDDNDNGVGGAKAHDATPLFSPIAGVLVGGGIGNAADAATGGGGKELPEGGQDVPQQQSANNSDDVELVLRFLESIMSQVKQQQQQSSSGPSSSRQQQQLPVEWVRPGPGFRALRDELDAYRSLSEEERVRVAQMGTMGPGRVARVARAFANRLVVDAVAIWRRRDSNNPQLTDPSSSTIQADDPQEFSQTEGEIAGSMAERVAQSETTTVARTTNSSRSESLLFLGLDPSQDRYACRTCRCLLFAREHLQDPPHVPSQHKFSHRKQQNGSGGVALSCESYFLQSVLPWMGDKTADVEGKVICPRCDTKLGSWNWSGAQCSCGTWVVPAIQIPRSRVDVVVAAIEPEKSEPPHSVDNLLPPGTVVSPVVLLRRQRETMATSTRNGIEEGAPIHSDSQSSTHQRTMP